MMVMMMMMMMMMKEVIGHWGVQSPIGRRIHKVVLLRIVVLRGGYVQST